MAQILLVDDDQFLREINSDTLISEGHQVTTALDGEDAYNKIKTNAYDLILLDVILPKMTGIEAVQKLKQESIQLKAKIIFLTNSDEIKDKAEAEALGGNFVMKSSLTPPDLIALVTKTLQNA